MVSRNKYAQGAKISNAEFRMMAQLFSRDASAVDIAEQTGLNRNTINRYIQEMRKRIITSFGMMNDSSLEEVSKFFGVLVTDGKIFVEPIKNEHGGRIKKLVTGKYKEENDELLKKWREYDGLLSIERSLQIYLNFGKTMRTEKPENVTIAEDFFIFVKERIWKFYGISRKHFFMHLKECEFRYNHRSDNIYELLLNMAKEKPLFSK